MKLVTYKFNGKEYVGVVTPSGNAVVPVNSFGYDYADMNDLIDRADASALKDIKAKSAISNGEISLENVELMAPIPVPKQEVICVGVNYMEHAVESARYKKEEFNGERPYPVYFCKRVNIATPDGGFIDGHFDIQNTLDYESELAVIIGKDADRVSKEDAFDYVFGYTIINDVTAREFQKRYKQFYFAKSLETFTCMGPWIVLKEDLPIPPAQHIMSRVNGETRQDNNTANMIFDIPYLISELSHGMVLKAGTIISTGTPSGVGMGFDPPKFMHPGDVVEHTKFGQGTVITVEDNILTVVFVSVGAKKMAKDLAPLTKVE